ncbi:ankyrin repeat protein [Seiridium cupressi]
MDAGASIIAFVTIGLQSIKTIYTVISAVKDGPSKLSDLMMAIGSLMSILEHLQNNPRLRPLPRTSSTDFAPSIEECTGVMKRFEDQVRKLQITHKETRRGKIWKRLKFVFQEDDIPYIISIITNAMQTLTLHFDIHQVAALSEVSAQQSEIRTDLAGISMGILQSSTQHTELVAKQSEALHILGTMDTNVTLIRDATLTQTDVASELASLKSELVQTMQKQFTEAITHHEYREVNSTHKRKSITRSHSSIVSKQLERLNRIVGEEPRIISGLDTEDISNAIEKLTRAVLKTWFDPDSYIDYVCTRRIWTSDWTRQFKQLMANFTTADSIYFNMKRPGSAINQPDRVTMYGTEKSIPHSIDGSLMVHTTKYRQSRDSDQDDSNSVLSPSSIDKTIVTLLVPGKNSAGRLLKASFIKTNFPEMRGQLNLAPTISVYRIVPNTSNIFHYIREGDLYGLQQSLRSGEASLRDRDEFGTSLLHYASAFARLNICKFLIDHGADVDDVALWRDYGRDYLASPLRLATGAPGEKIDWACSQLLLRGGADPSIAYAAHHALLQGAAEPTRILLSSGQPLIDIHTESYNGLSLFGIAMMNIGFEKLKLILDSGGKINNVDDSGPAALHELMVQIRMYRTWHEESEIIQNMIRHGADVFATWQGKSCSAIAYKNKEQGSYAGDLWDMALASMGYDISQFRIGFPHQANYTVRYTLSMFKDFWEGMESKCPYYYQAITYYTETEITKGSIFVRSHNGPGWETVSEGETDPGTESDSSFDSESELESDYASDS